VLGIFFRAALLGALALAPAACGDDIGGPGGPGGPGQQTGTLLGLVRDAGTADPIAGASLRIGGREGESGADGQFSIQNVPVGRRELIVSMPGYLGQAIEVDIRGNDTDELTIELVPDPGTDQLRITATSS
jgi:Carboxypeptidase regulatory-like domain